MAYYFHYLLSRNQKFIKLHADQIEDLVHWSWHQFIDQGLQFAPKQEWLSRRIWAAIYAPACRPTLQFQAICRVEHP